MELILFSDCRRERGQYFARGMSSGDVLKAIPCGGAVSIERGVLASCDRLLIPTMEIPAAASLQDSPHQNRRNTLSQSAHPRR
jgi:hypothetical protein